MTPLDSIDSLCALDAGGRGMSQLIIAGDMRAAARSLEGATRIILVTGFVTRPGLGAETDGPSGTVVLGRALRTLGAQVLYLTDSPALPLLRACLDVFRQPQDLVCVPVQAEPAIGMARETVDRFRPTHLVAVERLGRAADGGYYNALGDSVQEQNAPLDDLFLRPVMNAVTVGVGDGGNEIGMGRVRDRVIREIRHGAKIASIVRTDHLVVGGTSNWGAWGLAAHLATRTGEDLLHTPEEEARLSEAMVAAGGVDGLTGESVPTVDGLPIALHQAVLVSLRELTGHLMRADAWSLWETS